MDLFFLLSFVALLLSTASGAAPTATIDSGLVIGVATSPAGAKATVNKFLGIPFAAPPLRFAPAVKPKPWKKPFNATKYGPACYQQFNYPAASRNASMTWYNTPPPPAGESEDCLNLNIWSPPNNRPTNTAVLIWIYGGGFGFGTVGAITTCV